MKYLATLIASLCFSSLLVSASPNVVIFLADDQGWGDLSVHGNSNLRTPHIDSLAKDGCRFEHFYVCPVCSPTRAEFLTGRYHSRTGVWNVSVGGERLNLDEKTIADTFRAAGYATGAFGKWHNGSQYPYHPLGRGFSEYYGFTSGHWGDYFSAPLDHNGQPVQGEGFLADDLTNRAMQFIEKNKSKPFLCYIPFNTPHSPMQVPDRFYEPFKNADLKLRYQGTQKEDLAFTRAALAMCENLDENVGRLLKKLKELKLEENTIVLYFSDNGPNSWRWNAGMKGRKGTTDEGGVRSPLLVRWVGKLPANKQIASIAGAIDLHPTLAELAGIKPVNTKPFDGVSLAPLLLGKPVASDRLLFQHWSGNVSVRTQTHRLDNQGKLYDMTKDPAQEKDLADQQPALADKLRTAVATWKKETLLTKQPDTRPFPVGYRELPLTVLPARDGVAQGKIERSARAPNCSYFTNWTALSDSITWNVEVATAGKYEITIDYTCPEKDVGSEFEVSLLSQKLLGKVTVAHDPPQTGAEHDRVPRAGESYMKAFKPMVVGTLDLPQGKGTLTLKAVKVPRKQVMEVRAVRLLLK